MTTLSVSIPQLCAPSCCGSRFVFAKAGDKSLYGEDLENGERKKAPGARGCRKSSVFSSVKVKDTGSSGSKGRGE